LYDLHEVQAEVGAFERAGYLVVDVHRDRWPEVPLSRRRLHEDFHRFTDEELTVRTMDILVRKAS
jgi:hypothetical protein